MREMVSELEEHLNKEPVSSKQSFKKTIYVVPTTSN